MGGSCHIQQKFDMPRLKKIQVVKLLSQNTVKVFFLNVMLLTSLPE